MKKKILAIAIILIIIASIFIIKTINTKKYNYEIEKINEFNYYIYREDNVYGVIDKNGKIIVEAKYTNVIIPNPQREVFVCYNGNNTEILNSKNEKLFTQYNHVEPIKLKSVASTLTYEKSVLSYEKDGHYGIITLDGKEITSNVYDSIENLQPTEGKLLVSKNDKYGVIDIKGPELVKIEYDKILSDEYYTKKDEYKKSGFIVSIKTEDGMKSGYISYKGKKVLDTKYNQIERIVKEDKNVYLIASENGKYGLYKNNKNVIENEYQSMEYNDNDIIILQKNKKYGAATLDGKIIINVANETVESKGIYLYAKTADGNKVYDTKGNMVDINFNKTVYATENDEYRITTVLDKNIAYYGIIDKNGNQLVDDKYRYIEYLYKDYFAAKDEKGKFGIIDNNGREILESKFSSLQKVKGKNIIIADEEDDEDIFYSQDIKEVARTKNSGIQIEDDYIVITDGNDKIYLDNNGGKIADTSNVKKNNYPDMIGEYSREQITVENVYYVKK